MKCPECGSANVQKSSAVYEQGVHITEGRNSGAFLTSRGTIGVGASRTTSRSSSLATERNSPHRGLPPRAIIAGLVGGLIWFLLLQITSSFLLAIIVPIIILGMVIYLSAPNDQERVEERRYELQLYCKKCGNIFIPDTELHAETPAPGPDGLEAPHRTWWQRTFGS